MKRILILSVLACLVSCIMPCVACTGITLTSKDSCTIVARTIEWGGSDLNSRYVVVPRGYTMQSYLPGGTTDGMKFTARYGYVGLSVEQKEFVAEGLNEAGLSAGLFYFPNYGKYEDYNPQYKAQSIADLQLVSWVLGRCSTVDEVIKAIGEVHVVAIDPRASTVHWRFTDATGRQVVLEIIDGKARFYENPLGVLTNSPGLEWHLANLNNYVNLYPGPVEPHELGSTRLAQFGAGAGFLGLPGDVTPPSRFVRAAFYQSTAPVMPTAVETVMSAFQILNNFDIPIGVEFAKGRVPCDIPSATQWTSATDMRNGKIYYRTMYDSRIRCIDLRAIDFAKVTYRAELLDRNKLQPVETVVID